MEKSEISTGNANLSILNVGILSDLYWLQTHIRLSMSVTSKFNNQCNDFITQNLLIENYLLLGKILLQNAAK